MKKFLAWALCLGISLGGLTCTADEPAGRVSYLSVDFQDETAGKAPKSVMGRNGAATTAYGGIIREDAAGNKYVVIKDLIRGVLSESVASGTVVVEFDGNATTGAARFGWVLAGQSKWAWQLQWPSTTEGRTSLNYYDVIGAPAANIHVLKDAETGLEMSMAANEWQHYKLVVDFDERSFVAYVDGKMMQKAENITYFDGTAFADVSFFTAKSAGDDLLVDNIEVYRADCNVASLQFCDYENHISEAVETLPGALDCVKINFANQMEEDSVQVTLTDKATGVSEEGVGAWEEDGRTVNIRAQTGFFNSDTTYLLNIRAGYTDAFGQACHEPYSTEFTTIKGQCSITNCKILKDGTEVDGGEINAGDTIALQAEYVLTDKDLLGTKVILALAVREKYRIVDFGHCVFEMNEMGKHTVSYTMQLKNQIQFHSVAGYVWNAESREPMIDFIALEQ